jgi:hypothetical protein
MHWMIMYWRHKAYEEYMKDHVDVDHIDEVATVAEAEDEAYWLGSDAKV